MYRQRGRLRAGANQDERNWLPAPVAPDRIADSNRGGNCDDEQHDHVRRALLEHERQPHGDDSCDPPPQPGLLPDRAEECSEAAVTVEHKENYVAPCRSRRVTPDATEPTRSSAWRSSLWPTYAFLGLVAGGYAAVSTRSPVAVFFFVASIWLLATLGFAISIDAPNAKWRLAGPAKVEPRSTARRRCGRGADRRGRPGRLRRSPLAMCHRGRSLRMPSRTLRAIASPPAVADRRRVSDKDAVLEMVRCCFKAPDRRTEHQRTGAAGAARPGRNEPGKRRTRGRARAFGGLAYPPLPAA